HPVEWLSCFGRHGATLGAAPAFGYMHACHKVKKEELEGCDFSKWRIAIVGAEPLRAGQLEWFIDLFGPLGFRADAFCPAYGLAENTLAVTGVRPDEQTHVLPEGWQPAGTRGSDHLAFKIRHGSLQPRQIVSSGRPLGGVEVSIRN